MILGLPIGTKGIMHANQQAEPGKDFGATGYVNYIDPEMPDWASAYYGASLPKLQEVATRIDPRGVFTFPQGIKTRAANGGGSCSAPAWNASTAYVGGSTVSHNGHTWRAAWWTQGETPGQANVWADQGTCSGGA
jgi:chitinase